MYLPPVLGRHLAELDQLLGGRERIRRVDQRRPDPERASLHLLPNELPHAIELGRSRRPVRQADDVLAQGTGADERRDIRRHAASFEVAQIVRQRRPRVIEFDVALLGLPPRLHLRRQRAHRRALAENFRGDALPDVGERPPVDDERLGRPRKHVDEAGRHGVPGDAEVQLGGRTVEIPDRRDAIAAQADIRPDWRRALAVVHHAAAQEDVEPLRGRRGRRHRAPGHGQAHDEKHRADAHGPVVILYCGHGSPVAAAR